MTYFLLTILFTSGIAIAFKIFDRLQISLLQAIVVNYVVCIAIGLMLTDKGPPDLGLLGGEWLYFAFLLGALFLSTFYMIGLTTEQLGITVAVVAYRLSLIIPVVFAVLYYGERLTLIKATGIVLGMAAVYFTAKRKDDGSAGTGYGAYALPALLFVVSGAADTVIKYVQDTFFTQAQFDDFLITVFATSALISGVVLAWRFFRGQERWQWKNLWGGLLLGLPNYGSIYFFIKTLNHANLPASVLFPVNHIAILALTTLVAVVVFRERPNRHNFAGILLAILAIVVLTVFT